MLLILANLALIAGAIAFAIVRAVEVGVHLHSGSVSGQVRDLLWFALLCGLLASASLEIVKRLTLMRGAYQLHVLRQWLDGRLRHTNISSSKVINELQAAMGHWGDDTRRLFDLAPEQLLAQLATAADVAVTEPKRYAAPISVLLARGSYEDGESQSASGGPPPGEESLTTSLTLAETQRLRAALDDLQTTLMQRWRRAVQATAVWASGVYGILLTYAGGLSGAGQARYLFTALLLGGPIAWFVRDLAALLERAREQG